MCVFEWVCKQQHDVISPNQNQYHAIHSQSTFQIAFYEQSKTRIKLKWSACRILPGEELFIYLMFQMFYTLKKKKGTLINSIERTRKTVNKSNIMWIIYRERTFGVTGNVHLLFIRWTLHTLFKHCWCFYLFHPPLLNHLNPSLFPFPPFNFTATSFGVGQKIKKHYILTCSSSVFTIQTSTLTYISSSVHILQYVNCWCIPNINTAEVLYILFCMLIWTVFRRWCTVFSWGIRFFLLFCQIQQTKKLFHELLWGRHLVSQCSWAEHVCILKPRKMVCINICMCTCAEML